MKVFADNADYWMRKYIAENPNAPAEVLKSFTLMQDSDNELQCRIAENPNTPIEILKAFANNHDR
ncbi:MAG: hypothetical protein ACFCAD_04250 [Pleurocapsa sp.]